MKSAERQRKLHATLVGLGYKRVRSATTEHRYEGSEVVADGRSIAIVITFKDLEFTSLPVITLLRPEQEAASVVAHLSLAGELCFARNDDIVLDRYDVAKTVALCIQLARIGIERALTHKNLQKEISQEFPQHWQGGWFYYDFSKTGTKRPSVCQLYHASLPTAALLTDDKATLKRMLGDRSPAVPTPIQAIVLKTNEQITFQKGRRQPETLNEFLQWLDDFFPGQRDDLLEKMAVGFPKALPVYALAPNGCVGAMVRPNAMVGAAQRQQGLSRILRDHADTHEIERYSGQRIDVEHVMNRNLGGKAPLMGKRIALIGCGTIGGHLAKFLVQSGVGFGGGSLHLIDNQILEPGNLGRHLLGFPSIGQYKADALKAEIERQYSGANAFSFHADAVRQLDVFSGFDLIIDATGEEALSYAINQHFVDRRSNGTAPDVLHVRLFGNGAAAQGLLVMGLKTACFKCLRPDADGQWRFNPLKPGVEAVTTPAACGENHYIAYGVAAPAIAAALALQMTLDWSAGSPGHLLRTVSIDHSQSVQVNDNTPDRSERCVACSSTSTRIRADPA
jgi:molybdopterin/thiamine biosynthesis adenylyltransferase